MQIAKFSMQKVAYLLICLVLFFYLLIIGKNILVPLAFASLFSLLLKPIAEKVEHLVRFRPLAIILTLLIAILPLGGAIFFFSRGFVDVLDNFSSITNQIEAGITDAYNSLTQAIGMSKRESAALIEENSDKIISTPLSYLGVTIATSSTILLSTFLVFIYTFLLLLYRDSIKNFYKIQFSSEEKDKASMILKRVQHLIQQYLYGLILVIVILGVMNTAGLLLIGIKYAMFWGFLAAFLAIIPYIGAFLGGLIPFFYALATAGATWQPIAVVGLFTLIQILEGNIITPKVVGSSIKINPLAAILAVLIGSSIWGIAGLVLALPFIAILRVIFSQIDSLKAIGLLLSDELYEKEEVFTQKFDKERFRISSIFTKKTTVEKPQKPN